MILTSAAFAADKKDKTEPAKPIDSGSFGVFIKGQRVATETFSIEQRNGISIIKSQLKETAGSDNVPRSPIWKSQPLENSSRYEWSQSSGGSLTRSSDNEFLIEKIQSQVRQNPPNSAFLLPSAPPILDNNFFVHREVLAWRYLWPPICKPEGRELQVPAGCRPTLACWSRRTAPPCTSAWNWSEKKRSRSRGTERELLRLNLTRRHFDWALWVDDADHFKLDAGDDSCR